LLSCDLSFIKELFLHYLDKRYKEIVQLKTLCQALIIIDLRI